jgi:hypothetical protein
MRLQLPRRKSRCAAGVCSSGRLGFVRAQSRRRAKGHQRAPTLRRAGTLPQFRFGLGRTAPSALTVCEGVFRETFGVRDAPGTYTL